MIQHFLNFHLSCFLLESQMTWQISFFRFKQESSEKSPSSDSLVYLNMD